MHESKSRPIVPNTQHPPRLIKLNKVQKMDYLFFVELFLFDLLRSEHVYINSNTFAKQIQNFYHHHYRVVLCNGQRKCTPYITRTAKTLKYSPSGNMGSIG